MSCSLSPTDAEFTHARGHKKQSAEMTDKPLFMVALDGYDKLHWSHNIGSIIIAVFLAIPSPTSQTKQMSLTISLSHYSM